MTKTIILDRGRHPVSRSNIDSDAIKILYRLIRRGYTAYLVGGCIRDLFLGKKVKDFDIATNALPAEIRALFSNSRIIGRRFQLVHVYFRGRKIIEVATFRKKSIECCEDQPRHGMLIRRDNTFGTAEEDARRRDFTVNGIFYNIKDFTVIDHVGGLADLQKRIICTIGDPLIRFREDPVRMIRAVKFAARLGFEIEEKNFCAIQSCKSEIVNSPVPRVLEEIYRLFDMGTAEDSFHLLAETGLLDILMPGLYKDCARANGIPSARLYLRELDQYQRQGHPVSHALAWAALCYPVIHAHMRQFSNSSQRTKYVLDPIAPLLIRFQVSKKDRACLKDIFLLQSRFAKKRSGRLQRKKSTGYPGLQDAFAMFQFHVNITGQHKEHLLWWRQHLRERFPEDVRNKEHAKARRRRSHRKVRKARSSSVHKPS